MADVDGVAQETDPSAIIGVAVVFTGFKRRNLFGGNIIEEMPQPVCIPLVAHCFFRDLTVILFGIQRFFSGDVIPGGIHLVPLA